MFWSTQILKTQTLITYSLLNMYFSTHDYCLLTADMATICDCTTSSRSTRWFVHRHSTNSVKFPANQCRNYFLYLESNFFGTHFKKTCSIVVHDNPIDSIPNSPFLLSSCLNTSGNLDVSVKGNL